jgi:peptidoglycan lytic transglycosylase D
MARVPDSRLTPTTRGLIPSVAIAFILALSLSAHAAKRPRAYGPQRSPEPDVRRTVAGPGRPDPATPSKEPAFVLALRQAEREWFGPGATEPCGEFCPLLADDGTATISPSGLPPNPRRLEATFDVQPRGASSLVSLSMPDFPARLSDRALTYLDSYRNDPRGRAAAATWHRASGRYESMVKSILREYGLPQDLMWVAVVESRFDPNARSPVGAAGLWQFTSHTGRAYGLVIDRWVDERLDPVRSTRAAAMLLTDLHTRFGSWELALAAYNYGYAGVLAAIRKFNTNDFAVLSRYESGLPWETTLYVPKIVSLAIVGNNPGAFGLDGAEKAPPDPYDAVDVGPAIALSTIAARCRVSTAELQRLNPQYLASRTPPYEPSDAKSWRVRVPAGTAPPACTNPSSGRAAVLPPIHALAHGETLDEVARKFGVFRRDVANLNALRPNETLRPGTVLLIPRRADPRSNHDKVVVILPQPLPAPEGYERVYYRVVDGDSIDEVARALAIHVDELRGWNALDVGSRLHGGMTLVALAAVGRKLELPTLSEDAVRVIVAGSKAFYEHVERARGRVRGTIVIRPGDTWRRIAIRTGMTVSQLERINQRLRTSELLPGEKLTVYVPANKAWMVRGGRSVAAAREAPNPPYPGDLPSVSR